jgi:hypothetical protein
MPRYHIFEPKMNKIMSHIISLECVKILKHRKLCNLFVYVKMFKEFGHFKKIERLQFILILVLFACKILMKCIVLYCSS